MPVASRARALPLRSQTRAADRLLQAPKFQEIPAYATLHSHMIFFAIAKDESTRNRYYTELRKEGIDSRMPWTPINKQPCFPELNHLKLRKYYYLIASLDKIIIMKNQENSVMLIESKKNNTRKAYKDSNKKFR